MLLNTTKKTAKGNLTCVPGYLLDSKVGMVYSYKMLIGIYFESGLLFYLAIDHSPSRATTRHIRHCIFEAHKACFMSLWSFETLSRLVVKC